MRPIERLLLYPRLVRCTFSGAGANKSYDWRELVVDLTRGEMLTTAPELIAACEARDRARIKTLVSSIPREAWTVIPGVAMVQLEPLRILVWRESGGSGINTYETLIVQVIVDEGNARQFSYRFSADELQLPNYNLQ